VSSSNITIKDVARKAGVSIATVSRFLNNPTSLREENRLKVEKVVKELNYFPLSIAQRLAGGKLNIFGLVIPGYEGIFYSFYALEILRGVASALNAEKIDLHLHIFEGRDTFKASLVDGVIFADIIGNEKQFKRLIKEKLPLVVINRAIDYLDVSYVAVDNFKGAYEATDFLVSHGHKRVAHLAGDLRVQCARQRLEGYRSCLAEKSIDIREEYIKTTNFSRHQAREKLDEIFSLKDVPTAIFCCSDEVAYEVLTYAEEKNISVPKQLSVVGFDDNPLIYRRHLMLTTVRQPLSKMTSLGVKILQDIIKKKISPQKVILPTELIIRDTVSFL
jgi:DNA-binding LacI/PurR family transcriptional regulator